MSLDTKYINSLHKRTGGRVSEAMRIFVKEQGFEITRSPIIKRWKNAGFPLQSHGGHRHGMTEKKIRYLHRKYNGDLIKMAEESGYKRNTLACRCDTLRLPIINRPLRRRKDDVTVFDEPYDIDL